MLRKKLQSVNVNSDELNVFRDKRTIWDAERTVIVYLSDKLKKGQLRGIYKNIEKIEDVLKKLQTALSAPNARKQTKDKLEEKIKAVIKGQFMSQLFSWTTVETDENELRFEFLIDKEILKEIEDKIGLRIIMTDRHDWSSEDIIAAYQGQAAVEHTFKNIKNPYHLTIKPQFHWTDQKIIIHNFTCVLGYLLSAIAWRQVKKSTTFNGTLDNFLDLLNNIRLATILEETETRGKVKAIYKLEEITKEETEIIRSLNIQDVHTNKPKIRGVSVYS